MIKPKMILFDVYETLLNIDSVKSRLNEALNTRRGYRVWLELCMQYSFVDIITEEFRTFEEHSSEALKTASAIFGQTVNEQLNDDIFLLMRHAPLQEEVQESLSALSNEGYILAALSNISSRVLYDRMESTGLISYFDFILSAEDIQQYKPSGHAYRFAAKKADIDVSAILMVTSHWWDIRGAAAAGLQTAYLQRNDPAGGKLSSAPLFILNDLSNLHEKISSTFISE